MDISKLILKQNGEKVKDIKLQNLDMRKIEIEINMKGGSSQNER